MTMPSAWSKATPGAESVYLWNKEKRRQSPRGGADGRQLFGRGAGEGFGVHICTGPVEVRGAEPGDILEVRIIDVKPRPSRQPEIHRQGVRQQRRRMVGLPLQGSA